MADEQAAAGGGNGLKTPPPDERKRKKKRKSILKKGQILANNYEIQSSIGEGGMAVVYKAWQKSLGRAVAVKALHPRLAKDDEFVKRFDAEAGALAGLSHPNIINIIEKGCENDIYFFIMEYIDGEDLDQKIIANTLTVNDWRKVVDACADALEYVHKRGIIHRDIKPSNILVDADNRVKIGDFGIAHMIQGEEEDTNGSDSQEQSSRALGTKHYMAPEQSINSSDVDHRADIFSLGVAFYKMMTRKLPVGDYPAPSEVNSDIPVSVDEVLFRAMAYDPDDRYQSVREFCDAMQKALKEQSVNITSVLAKRKSKTGSGALYTGEDFSRSSSSAEIDVSSVDKDKRSSSFGGFRPKTGTGTGTGTVKTSTTKTKTSTGTGSGKAAAVAGGAPPKKKTGLIVAIVAVILIAVGAIAGVVLSGGLGGDDASQPMQAAPALPVDSEEIKSDARLFEEQKQKELEERQRELLEKARGARESDSQ